MNVEIRCDSRKAACSLLDNEPASGKRGEGVGGGGGVGGGQGPCLHYVLQQGTLEQVKPALLA